MEVSKCILDLPYYEDKEELLSILTLDLNTPEVFSMLLGLVSAMNIEQGLSLVKDIDPSFTRNFINVLGINIEKPSEIKSIDKYINSYLKFKDYIQKAIVYSDKYLSNPELIGLEFYEYFKQYMIDKGATINTEKPTVVAIELVGLACLSSDGVNNHITVIRQHLNELFSEVSNTTSTDIAVVKLISGMTNG
jgi:hypothetical protein